MIRTIFGRLLLSHIAVILVTVLTFGFLMSYLMRVQIVELKRRELLTKGASFAEIAAPELLAGRTPTAESVRAAGELIGANLWLADRSGAVIAGSPPERWLRRFPERYSQVELVFAGEAQSWVRTARRQSDPSIVVGVPLPGIRDTALFIHTPITGVTRAAEALENLLMLAVAAGMAAAVLLGWMMSRSLTRPIADIGRAADRFARGDLSSRTAATGRNEIGRLGSIFNGMAVAIADADQNRREFLANVSHELKTPVASIQALAEALQDGMINEPEQEKRYLGTIVTEAGRIGRLVDDLLELSRLDSGELRLEPVRLDLPDFLRQGLEKYRPLTVAKNLTLDLSVTGTPPAVLADPDRLQQILDNLITNAVRYAPNGSTVAVAVFSAASGVNVSVRDSGPGIPAEELPLIWERFYRVEKSRARQTGGTGLGLAIAKKLVAAMGGAIDVTSRPGCTTFTFSLPQA